MADTKADTNNIPNEQQGIKEIAWPPKEWGNVMIKYAEHAAWYSGDPESLITHYATYTKNNLFWSKRTKEKRVMLHIPIAGDIASASADMIFGEPPSIFIPESQGITNVPDEDKDSTVKIAEPAAVATQNRLDEILIKGHAQSTFFSSGETAAFAGGVYMKVDWDKEIADYPFLSVAQPDAAFPTFKFGRFLTEVKFYRLLSNNGGKSLDQKNDSYIRHMEHHLIGKVINKLYRGTASTLGSEIPLDSLPETEGLQEEVDTLIKDILVRYIPNRLPNRLFRGSPLGSSDYSGIETLMDQLDEVYTAWMDDVRKAKGRVVVPEEWITVDRSTGETSFDLDKSIFAGLPGAGLPGEEQTGLTIVQFAIRAVEFEKTCNDFLQKIITLAGYSPQSFGLGVDGRAESGTALRVRERKSLKTKQKKEALFKGPLEDLCYLLLEVDSVHFQNTDIDLKYRPVVEFADSIVESLEEIATAVQKISAAGAASKETIVKYLHPEWSDEQVTSEVERIKDEDSIEVQDPFAEDIETGEDEPEEDENDTKDVDKQKPAIVLTKDKK